MNYREKRGSVPGQLPPAACGHPHPTQRWLLEGSGRWEVQRSSSQRPQRYNIFRLEQNRRGIGGRWEGQRLS